MPDDLTVQTDVHRAAGRSRLRSHSVVFGALVAAIVVVSLAGVVTLAA